MADNRNNDSKKDRRKINIDEDYIELLNEYDDKFEDVYSNSSDYKDVYSDSSKDVYIGKSKRNSLDSENNIYVSKPQQRSTRPHPPESNRQMSPTAPPPTAKQTAKRVQNMDTEDISDFEARHGKKKKIKGPNVGVIVLVVILVVIIGFGGIIASMAGGIVSKFTKGEEIQHIEDVASLKSDSNVKNILLIGADKAKGGRSRSDSIMIASVNKSTGRITVCSILRDTHLDIPGERESKINAAYAWGGANLLVQTIEENFKIKIDDYATVDFNMFTALIDGLGGIDVDVTEDEADYINNRHNYKKEEKPETVPSGKNVHLTGYQALWYARIRKLDSDFNRTERQRKVISAIMKDVKSKLTPTGVFSLISTAKNVAPFIETTLSTGDFWGLMTSLMSCVAKSGGNMDKLLVTDKIPFDDTWWYSSEWDGSSISIDLEENRNKLQYLLYEDYELTVPEETTDEE